MSGQQSCPPQSQIPSLVRAVKCLALGGLGTWALAWWLMKRRLELGVIISLKATAAAASCKWVKTASASGPGGGFAKRSSVISQSISIPFKGRQNLERAESREDTGDLCISGPMGAPRGFHFLSRNCAGVKAAAWEDGQKSLAVMWKCCLSNDDPHRTFLVNQW